jgi:Transketolase, C-terminal domain
MITTHGVSAGLINLRSPAPVDERAILHAARTSRTLVVVEDHFAIGGLGTIVAEVLARHGVATRLRVLALEGRWFRPALLPDVLEYEGFTAERITARVEAVVMSATGLSTITRSDALWARAQGLITAGTQTLSKGPGQHVRGVVPKYLRRGRGCRVWDVDGNAFTDLSMGTGPLIFGYGHPARQGRALRVGYNLAAAAVGLADVVRCVGMHHRGMVTFDARAGDPLVLKSVVRQELIRRGVPWAGFHNVAWVHTEADVEAVLWAYREALGVLRGALDRGDPRKVLQGETVEPVFRRIGSPATARR